MLIIKKGKCSFLCLKIGFFFLLYFFDLFIFFLLAQQPKEEPGNWRGKHDEEAMYLYL